MDDELQELLARRIAHVQAWYTGYPRTERPSFEEEQWRSEELCPFPLYLWERFFHFGFDVFDHLDVDQRAMVEHVCERRANALSSAGLEAVQPRPDGRVLMFLPQMSLGNGASQNATGGFFDGDNAPPWDTWLVYLPAFEDGPNGHRLDVVLSWIPRELVELVDRGVRVDQDEECLYWFDDGSPWRTTPR